jgi:hypothetical protein
LPHAQQRHVEDRLAIGRQRDDAAHAGLDHLRHVEHDVIDDPASACATPSMAAIS